MKEFFEQIPAEAIYVSIAAIGGMTRYLQKYLGDGSFTWRHFLAHTFVSSFSGYMFFQCATHVLGLPDKSLAVVAGLGGWMGVEALKMIEAVVRDKFQKK